jgi:hypothetical protein
MNLRALGNIEAERKTLKEYRLSTKGQPETQFSSI